VPPENPLTADKVNLGKALFWDEQLSATGNVACATCHMPEAGGTDPRTPRALHPGPDEEFGTADDVHGTLGVILNRADGHYVWEPTFGLTPQVTPYKSPSVFMSAYEPELFREGRAGPELRDPMTNVVVIPRGAALEVQALAPLISDVEMNHLGGTWPKIETRVREATPLALSPHVPVNLRAWLGTASYPDLFARAFGTPSVTAVRIAMALASYQRTLIPNQAPIDRYLAGETNALSPQERRGLAVFAEVGRCTTCHAPPFFGHAEFFNIGVRPWQEDRGRANVTGRTEDRGAFKVPSLRNVAQRAPFFRPGHMATLNDVIDFYARGGDFHEHQTPLIQPFSITAADRAALRAFLTHALTDPRPARAEPPFDHPALFADSSRVPAAFGHGLPGTDRRTPHLLAAEPPLLGNREFGLALVDGLAGAPALLLLDTTRGYGARFLGFPLYVGASANLHVLPLGALYHGSGRGDGYTTVVLVLPGDPALAGTELFLQGLVLDSGARAGIAATAGQRVGLFAAR
jgi:cytochrome c peroxidase